MCLSLIAPTALLALALVTTEGAPPPASPLWGPLRPGPHAVGFRVLNASDPTRRLPGATTPRPIQIAFWYPARAPLSPEPMSYGDYVRVTASERTLEGPTTEQAEETTQGYLGFLERTGVPRPASLAWLHAAMEARRDAEAAPGRFPLVLVAQGNGGAVPDHALLGEYLASQGYVVATSPSPVRLGDVMKSDADILGMAETQARDLAFLADRLRAVEAVDRSRLGVVGYSFGGRSALLFAGRDPKVRAFVSLDSGIAVKTGKGWLPRTRLDPAALRTPVLHVFEDTEDMMAPDFGLLAACKGSDRTLMRVADLGHFEFITYGMASAVFPEFGPEGKRRGLALKIEAVFEYTKAFLDAHLKADAVARRFLDGSPMENGYPDGLLTLIRMAPGH